MTTIVKTTIRDLIGSPDIDAMRSYEVHAETMREWLRVILMHEDSRDIADEPVLWHPDGIALTNTHDEKWWWGMMGERFTCHAPTPYALLPGKLLQAMAEAASEIPEGVLASETMTIPNIELLALSGLDDHFLWMHSPVVRITGTYQDYVASLTSRRRRRERLDREAWDRAGLYFTIDREPWGDDHMAWAAARSQERWGDAAGHNISLCAWAAAVSRCDGHVLTMRIYRPGHTLQAMVAFIERERGQVFFQTIVQAQDIDFSNLGSAMMFKLVEWMCQQNAEHGPYWKVYDPTCRTDLVPDSIDVYKRYCVNQDTSVPMILAGREHTVLDWTPTPPYYFASKDGWHRAKALVGDPL